MIPEESDEDLPVTAQGNSGEVDTIPYAPGTLKISSSTWPLMTPLKTQ